MKSVNEGKTSTSRICWLSDEYELGQCLLDGLLSAICIGCPTAIIILLGWLWS